MFIISWMELRPESPRLPLRESYEEMSCLPEGLGLLCVSPEGRAWAALLQAAEVRLARREEAFPGCQDLKRAAALGGMCPSTHCLNTEKLHEDSSSL